MPGSWEFRNPLQVVCGAANVSQVKSCLGHGGCHFARKLSDQRIHLTRRVILRYAVFPNGIRLSRTIGWHHGIGCGCPPRHELREYLNLDDYVLDIDLTPNRADCFSLLGVARELSVLNNLPLLEPAVSKVPASLEDVLPVHVHEVKPVRGIVVAFLGVSIQMQPRLCG